MLEAMARRAKKQLIMVLSVFRLETRHEGGMISFSERGAPSGWRRYCEVYANTAVAYTMTTRRPLNSLDVCCIIAHFTWEKKRRHVRLAGYCTVPAKFARNRSFFITCNV